MSKDNESSIVSVNMTNFFNRELFMYSLGDIKFKKPVSLRKVAYTTLFLIVWSTPIILIFGFQLNLFFVVIAFGPAIVLGNIGAKPLFGGKSLADFVKTTVNFIQEPKGWTDLEAKKQLTNEFFVENEIWVSRRRELQYLADLKEARRG